MHSEITENQLQDRERLAERFLMFIRTAKNIEPFHGQKVENIFNSEESKRELIKKIKFDEFLSLINGINGVLRDKPQEEWKMDGENVYLGGGIGKEVPPPFEQKEPLLVETFEAAKRMEKDGRDLEDIAILVSVCVNAIHPYSDGNGRTSRVIYTMLMENFDSKNLDNIKKVLGDYGRLEVDINPGILLGGHIYHLIDKELGIPEESEQRGVVINRGLAQGFDYPNGIDFKRTVDKDDEKKFKFLVDHDHEFMFFAIYKYLEDNPDREKYFTWYGKRARTNVELLANDLDLDGLKKILDNYAELKKQRVEILIDSIENPDKEEYKIKKGGKIISFYESFKEEIYNEIGLDHHK